MARKYAKIKKDDGGEKICKKLEEKNTKRKAKY